MDTMPADLDPSHPAPVVQWPSSQPWPHHRPDRRLAVLASGAGTNFEALVRACREGPLAAAVVALVVNRAGCGAARRAEALAVPCRSVDHRHHPERESLDRELVGILREHGTDLVVMAGWMRIVTPVLIDAFPDRVVNIHPSLLPSFRGMDAVGQALAAGVTLAGCTAHLVRPEVDAGPILAQAAVPVLPGDDRDTLTARIQVQEHRILPLAVALAAAKLEGGENQDGLAPPPDQG